MKKLLLIFLVFPIISYGQVQIGQVIDGEASGDAFGQEISLSSDGTIIAISAPNNDGNGEDSGHVRVYENINNTWTQIGDDINGEAAGDLTFFVSLSSDGSIVAIGAPANDGNANNAGHVRIFKNESGVWTQIGEDIDSNGDSDRFGSSVSLSSDGTIVAIGSRLGNGNGIDSGRVRVYENINNTWIQINEDINGEAAGDQAGFDVSLSSDGNIVAVGAPANDGNGNISGHVRIYENKDNVWNQIGQDIDGEANLNGSGANVSLSCNGSIVAIGASGNNDSGNDSGHVRVYKNIDNTWTQIGQDIDGEAAFDRSGTSVSLSCDGSVVAIGAPGNSENDLNTGHVRIYQNQNGTWVQIGQDIDGELGNSYIGTSVSLSYDGRIVATGAFRRNSDNTSSTGHVEVYSLSGLLSLNEFNLSQFSIYPNPVSNQVTIVLQNKNNLQKIKIYNSLGQIVHTTQETRIDTSQFSKGIYYIEVTTNQGISSKKLIVE